MYVPRRSEDDLDEIRPGLYLGSQRAEARPLATLQEAYGITHVVQVGTGEYMLPSHKDVLTYCCIRALDYDGEDLLLKLKDAKVHDFIDAARSRGGKVLVHCHAGISRSATTVISYLMVKETLGFEKALAEVITKRPCVAPNPGFCDQLRTLEEECACHLDKYSSQKSKRELSVTQWLALLMQLRNHRDNKGARPQVLGCDTTNDLQGFNERLALRKRLGTLGLYDGAPPPDEPRASNCKEDK